MIVGTSNSNGLLYEGPISGVGGTSYSVNVPGAETTSVYGSNSLPNGDIQLVGSYRTGTGAVDGFLFGGSIADLSNPAAYTTIAYPGATYTYVHSTMGGLAVGNADGPEGNAPIGTGHAFIYDIDSAGFTPIIYPGATTTTAYGIWYNGQSSYTIVGGYTMPGESGNGLSHGYMVDYDRATGQYSNWTSFDYPNGPIGQTFITHFEGISSDEEGVYTLSATSVSTATGAAPVASWVTVRRNTDGSFGPGQWVPLTVPTGGATTLFTSNDSVAGNANVGIVITDQGEFSYQALVNTGFQLSNVISGNLGNGVGIYGGSDNQVAMNDIGTDSSGSFARPNRQNGILITNGATGNLIGGEATGGNDPTGNVFVRPPQGNLISGNGANGVLITGGATQNQLSGNFVGTSASGLSALGNRLDGVAIVGASGNSLLGCTFQQDPFVFYNVLSGNGGNGLRITNSNDTTVQANFLGVGANNDSIVANGGDGLLVSGSSANTQVGGVIPLGNVISGNNQNGIEVRDRASGFTSFNTFGGLYAFGTAAPNRRDGILITSSGGNNLVRTSIISGNRGNGIELGGHATGVQVTETGVGTDTKLSAPLPNLGDGILIAGNAHNNAIGGFQPSIEPHVTISSNAGYGIRVAGSARNNVVFNTVIGTNAQGTVPLGNRLGGIYLAPGTSSTIIGGPSGVLEDEILFNGGNGVTMNASSGNVVLSDQIQSNAGTGVFLIINGGRNDQIGSPTAGNAIEQNGGDGVYVMCFVPGSTVAGNTIAQNAGNGLTLAMAEQLLVGGAQAEAGNHHVVSNGGFGLYAFGLSTGTLVQANTILLNAAGECQSEQVSGDHVPPVGHRVVCDTSILGRRVAWPRLRGHVFVGQRPPRRHGHEAVAMPPRRVPRGAAFSEESARASRPSETIKGRRARSRYARRVGGRAVDGMESPRRPGAGRDWRAVALFGAVVVACWVVPALQGQGPYGRGVFKILLVYAGLFAAPALLASLAVALAPARYRRPLALRLMAVGLALVVAVPLGDLALTLWSVRVGNFWYHTMPLAPRGENTPDPELVWKRSRASRGGAARRRSATRSSTGPTSTASATRPVSSGPTSSSSATR